ncbi:MAG: vanadium-dependent haloperoxidase [Methyloprofundus sp.]
MSNTLPGMGDSCRLFVCATLFLLFPAISYSQEESADAVFDLDSGQVCFPVNVSNGEILYDVCLSLTSMTPNVAFDLTTHVERDTTLTNIATYSPEEGLLIPVARLSDGRVFRDIGFTTFVNPISFEVNSAKEVTPDSSQSVARQWNEALLGGIRQDFARPTVHARNLFHTSIIMYDAWAAYDGTASTYLLGKTVDGFECAFNGIPASQNIEADRAEAIAYASYRLLSHRFENSPGATNTLENFDDLFIGLNHDATNTSVDYSSGEAAALGNYLAQCMINFGLQDGANEVNAYAATVHAPVNTPMAPTVSGNPVLEDHNRWQPLSFNEFRDQSGNISFEDTPEFVGPEWGQVSPFALEVADLTIKQRDGFDYWVYHDPGAPPYLNSGNPFSLSDEYKWGFELVVHWSSHLDPGDGVMLDISPASIGNLGSIDTYPRTVVALRDFYNGSMGDPSVGHELNPHTGEPYEAQIVAKADYARVLAEFWADGPDSETPPGHWFTLLNYVNDHPLAEKRFKGEGELLNDLEWDVKSYFAMAGTVHDAAVTAWGIKGWYDYIRPISAIRFMADKGQSSDTEATNYDPDGISLSPGLIEIVEAGDALAGDDNENLGKIKVYAWRGPDFVLDPETDFAGVGWILAENWWPYQRPSFVTPPFAGYVSGHSTFSRAAAELMTLLTGDEFFPGGMGEFEAPKNEFLVFEEGPSMDITLQWATYRDASDQTSLSRIWGGIHPPADDIPGRRIGAEIGVDAFNKAEEYFTGIAQ